MTQLKHLVRVADLDQTLIEHLFGRTKDMIAVSQHHGSQRLSGYIGAMLFYEPSTRTRLSFEAAMHRLGGRVIGTESAGHFSSVTKGETLEDTIRVISGYADVVVLRHNEVGAAARAASVSAKPVINAGDGIGEHPTQALLDLYTIQAELPNFDRLNIVMVGDLKHGRTVHSLARLLCNYPVRLIFVSPDALKLPNEIREELEVAKVHFEETTDLRSILPDADVIYMTRVQKERFASPEAYEEIKDCYRLDAAMLAHTKPTLKILHPLPRNQEIAVDVDADHARAAYFRQADNGLFVRMALLDHLLRG